MTKILGIIVVAVCFGPIVCMCVCVCLNFFSCSFNVAFRKIQGKGIFHVSSKTRLMFVKGERVQDCPVQNVALLKIEMSWENVRSIKPWFTSNVITDSGLIRYFTQLHLPTRILLIFLAADETLIL